MDRDFEKMGIYDLRNYARLVGVKAPTTLKRDELIEKINQIIEGNAPKAALTKKGRPPRHKQTDEYMLDIILPDKMFSQNDEKYKPIPNVGILPNYQNLLSESNYSKLDNLPFEGYFDNYSKDFGIAYLKGYLSDYSRENVIILQNLIKENNLKYGDYVKGVAKYIQSKNVTLASSIDKINDKNSYDEFERINFEDIHPLYPTQKLQTDKIADKTFAVVDKLCPMTKGARISVQFKYEDYKQDVVKNLLETFRNNNLKTFLISIGDRPENIGELIRKFDDVIFVEHLPSQKREDYFKKIDIVVKNACNRVECGEDVVLMFYNTKNFINTFKQQKILFENCNDLQANILAENKFFDIYNLSKCGDLGSLTIVALDPTEYISMQSNCYMVFAEMQNGILLDLKNSRTENIEKILSNNDLKLYNDAIDAINSGHEEFALAKLLG